MRRSQVYKLINDERFRQDEKFGTEECKKLTQGEWLAILVEEVGEVAKELCDHRLGLPEATEKELKKELIQCAAVVVKWMENYPWQDQN